MANNGAEPFGVNYVTANRFYVEIESELSAAFSECQGLGVQIDKEVIQEGGATDHQRVLLKHAKYSDVTLKRGMTDSILFWNWINSIVDPGIKKERRNANILIFNQAGETMQSWTLIGAVPIGWKAPSLQADSNSLAIEELTLAYEGLKIQKGGGSGGATVGVERNRRTGYFPTN